MINEAMLEDTNNSCNCSWRLCISEAMLSLRAITSFMDGGVRYCI
jgi:hypothetical protein